MLKRKRMITTCSLSSCRIKAEALARVFNSRIWPCTWADRRRRTEDSAEEDEEYFEASPVEDGDEERGRDSSAATEEGRAKLLQLLHQHANDDATEVFYDVSDHVENASQSAVEEDGFEEIRLRDGIPKEAANTATGDVINRREVLRNGDCERMPINCAGENSSVKRSCSVDGAVIREEPKTSSFEKEVLALTWDSGALEPNQIEIYPKYSNGFLGEANVNKAGYIPEDTDDSSNDSAKQEIDVGLSETETSNFISDAEQENINAFEFEKEEILTVSIDSESCTINQTELYDKKVVDALNEVDITSSQKIDTTAKQETENCSKDTEKEILTLSIDSKSCTINQTKVHDDKLADTFNKSDFLSNQNLDTTTKQETENCSKDTEKEETLTVSIDSESCFINQTEVHNEKLVDTYNEPDILGNQNLYTTTKQETDLKDTEKEEILTVSIDSESCIISQTEVNDNKVVDANNEVDITSSQKVDTTAKQEIESESKDTETSVSIEIIKSSPPEKDTKKTSKEHISKIDTDFQENCRLHVFNGARPAISRSTSLKTGKTPPGTPSRKKIVRFADVLGLDLEDVRHIISGDLPNIPSSAFSDLVLPDEDLPAKCTPSTKLELTGIQQGSWENIQLGASGVNAIYPLFDIPGQQHDFIDRVRNNGICLENIIISDFNVQCTCRVMNWGFSKKVVARYSMDKWNSSQDISATYVSNSSRDGMDSFAFNIFLSQQRRNVEFALCFTVNDTNYWDNNGGKNYCLGYHSNDSIGHTPVPTSPTWIHQFW